MSQEKKTIEEVVEQYAKEQELKSNVNGAPIHNDSPANHVPKGKTFREEVVEDMSSRPTLKEAQEIRRQEILETTRGNRLGYMEVKLEDLPSGGIFYPEGTTIWIRAASGQDIRQWSMTNDDDLTSIDDAINSIIERCVNVSFPKEAGVGSWKDIKEFDRLYILLAIREFTFTEGHNELLVPIDETNDVAVTKDHVEFVNFPEGLFNYYNAEERCFTIESSTPNVGKINFYLPSTGVNQWVRNYILEKRQNQENIDLSFCQIAPILIKDYRQLTNKKYQELVAYTHNFSGKDWSIINHVWKTLKSAVSPKIRYVDGGGVEREAALNFRGGILSIFIDNSAVQDLGF